MKFDMFVIGLGENHRPIDELAQTKKCFTGTPYCRMAQLVTELLHTWMLYGLAWQSQKFFVYWFGVLPPTIPL